MLIGIPIRSFITAKQRLASHLNSRQRREFAERLAEHVLTITSTVAEVAVVTADDDIRQWARNRSVEVLEDGGSLNGAGQAVVRRAADIPWGVLHADLPTLSQRDLEVAKAGFTNRGVSIAPSWDGGTSLIMATGPFAFSYGPGSFHEHLAERPEAAIIIRSGLALDIDEPEHVTWLLSGRLEK